MGEIRFITEPVKVRSGETLDGRGTRLVGGVKLAGFEPVGDGVYRCDLAKLGIKPLPMRSRGFSRDYGGGHSELFLGGRPCNISQYPKKGKFLTITGFSKCVVNEWGSECGALDGGFCYDDPRPGEWARSEDIWAHGYWAYDWANSYERVELLDGEKRFVTTAAPHGNFQFIKGQRFYFLNVREEVTEPGDYCVDYAGNAIYVKPFEDGELSDALLSTADFPAFDLRGVHDAVVENFEVSCFAHDAVRVVDCDNVVFRGLTLHNIGGRAGIVRLSRGVSFERCEVYDTGDGGFDFACGSRMTLTPANCGVRNCRMHDIAKWSRTYTPPVHLRGVGLFAENNEIYDCPHTAILFLGNDMTVTDNVIYRVLLETGDAGAIYTGRNYTFRGNTVSRNLIALTGGVGMGTMGIYNDDCVSGTVMEDNVFYKVRSALFMGGGRDFIARGNVFVDCFPSVEIDSRGASPHPVWRNMITSTMRDRFYNVCEASLEKEGSYEPPDAEKIVSGAGETYIARYPELAEIDALYASSPEPLIKPSALLEGNVVCPGREAVRNGPAEDFAEFTERDVFAQRNELRGLLTPEKYEKLLLAGKIEITGRI